MTTKEKAERIIALRDCDVSDKVFWIRVQRENSIFSCGDYDLKNDGLSDAEFIAYAANHALEIAEAYLELIVDEA